MKQPSQHSNAVRRILHGKKQESIEKELEAKAYIYNMLITYKAKPKNIKPEKKPRQ
ncbi:MAG: hypothetical protein QXO15_10560 [Nitrososphaerota archaeon]